MVRDAYSASSQPQQADGSAGNTANLTQELAQLLAQSIAQGQSGKRPPGAAATGSELASLAALVSASQHQRAQPSYRDGLSSLSYARPAQSPAPVAVPVAAASSMLVNEPHDEEPMPIPSTWRQPMLSDDDRWYRQQLGAAALGLIAGLIVVVPAVLWLTGGLAWLGGPKSTARQTTDQAPVKIVEVKPQPIKAQTVIPVEPRSKTELAAAEPPPAPAVKVEPARARADEVLVAARRKIEGGDVMGARELLQTAEVAASGPLTFMLAETYDPNMLAGWQTRGVPANPERARALYQKARELGEARAQQRLDWLMAN